MYRIEAINHDGKFELLKLFDLHQKDEAKRFVEENENYFLRAVKAGNPRTVLFQNFDKFEIGDE